ncbi:hypothetical protein PBAL39_15704 [Pedobacter sp. BAL39]|uniref:peptidoglycan-binding protein n=1 Tax=Pedobacter sp. BAL39 TaxID=391596 RepID=UPI0001559FD7|nr:peptidoglycan-binding protein [Pedobacter sp. BAL39]EDM37884.1 hypothetical protein PBAL39_15704 [Pedobacter sp. BAL39]
MLRDQNDLKRSNIVQLAQRETGVREIGNTNRGKRVEEYLAYVSLTGGEPWCAAYISWIYGQGGYVKPRSAWSPDLLPASRLVKMPLSADVFGIYFPELKRIAHVGIVVSRDGDWILGSEGNTNVDGSREGNGVYLKRRHIRTIAKYADWVTNGKEVGQ